jgi:hypothetical protein
MNICLLGGKADEYGIKNMNLLLEGILLALGIVCGLMLDIGADQSIDWLGLLEELFKIHSIVVVIILFLIIMGKSTKLILEIGRLSNGLSNRSF